VAKKSKFDCDKCRDLGVVECPTCDGCPADLAEGEVACTTCRATLENGKFCDVPCDQCERGDALTDGMSGRMTKEMKEIG
jgi:hypothetical protein